MYQGKCSATLNIIEPGSCHKPCLANSKTLDNGKRWKKEILRIHPRYSCHHYPYQCTVTVFLLHNIEITVNPCESCTYIGHHRTPSDFVACKILTLLNVRTPSFAGAGLIYVSSRSEHCPLHVGASAWGMKQHETTHLSHLCNAYGVKGKPSSRCTQDQWLSLGAFLQGISQFSSVILIPRRL